MKQIIAILVVAAFGITACTTDPYTGERQVSKTAMGAGIGAAAGAAIGALTGGKRGKRALIGAASGALAGGAVGYYMDRQESKLRERLQATGVSVTRDGDYIILNMPSDITFDVDRSGIKPSFYDVLNSVTLVLKEFDKTYVNVMGHADSTGAENYNLNLSVQRADSVGQYLVSQGINAGRVTTMGFGETQPIASNATAQGRALNRRVEIKLEPIT